MHTIPYKSFLSVFAAAAALVASGCTSVPISGSQYNQGSPAIFEFSVVWEDSRNAETDGTDIYMRDIGAPTEKLVAGGRGDQEQPAVSGRYVVWLDAGKLRAFDRTSGAVFNVTSGPATQTDPALCGSVVTWTDSRGSSPDVYARDLAGGAELAVAASSTVEAYPACDAGRIVYMYAPTGEWASIRLFDLSTRRTTVVSEQSWNEWRPAISEDRVVWQAWPNQPDTTTGIQIMGKRLSTGETFTVTSGPGNQTAPVISGTMVAWEDFRSGESRVWWRDLGTTVGEAQVDPSQGGRQQAPAMGSNRWLVDQSDVLGPWNVYTVGLLSQG